jgi:NADPH2:quinone reductase
VHEDIMARVIRIHENGDPSVLRIEDEQVGAPGRGEVRLVQEAIGINFVDGMVREGVYPQALPTIPGFEAAGVIAAVAPDVTAFAPGDRVAYFFSAGAYATERTLSSAARVRLPDDIPTVTAARFLATGLTAWVGLRVLHPLRAGETALILGASGSVGSMLSRWARDLGATVIGVAGSPGKIGQVRAGATHALLAGEPAIVDRIHATAPGGVDVVYDLVGQATFDLATAALRTGGTIVTLGAASGQPRPDASELARRHIAVRGGGMPQFVRGSTVDVATSELWDALRKGVFADLRTVEYSFTDVVRAHVDMAGRKLEGLPVLIV